MTDGDFRTSPSGEPFDANLDPLPSHRLLGNPSETDTALPTPITTSQMLDFLDKALLGWLFDGTANAFVSAGNVLDFGRLSAFTISGWYRTRTIGNTFIIASKQGSTPALLGYAAGVRSVGYFFRLNNNNAAPNSISVDNTTIVHDTELRQFVVSYDGSASAAGVLMYHDRVAIPTVVNSDSLSGSPSNSFDLAIGARPVDGASPPNGQIADVSIWNKALSLAEIQETAVDGLPAPDLNATSMAGNLVWWIRLNEDDALGPNGFVDQSASGFDGTASTGVSLDTEIDSLIIRGTNEWQLAHIDEVVFPSLVGAVDMPKFFLSAQGGSAAAINLYNVASLSDDGLGTLGVVLGTPFASTSYCALATVNFNSSLLTRHAAITNKLAGSFQIASVVESGSRSDPSFWYAVGFGDLAP